MTPLESIFYMLWRGLAVGVLISAPMGPVGILCIQRTLDRGRKAGFYTGIGAAISDLFYCLLTGFGLSFIEDFLQENSNVIQLFGSLVLIAFSIYLFKKNPSSSLRRPVPQNVSVKKNILGGFLFTFSNPLIIFLIIGLFARFNFTSAEINGGFYAVGYLFIIIGALLWWYAVTYLIDKVRMRFNMRSMKRLNIAIGIVILAFACVGIVSSIIGLTSADARANGSAEEDYTGAFSLMSVNGDRYYRLSLSPHGMSESGEWLAAADENGMAENEAESLRLFSREEFNSMVAADGMTLDINTENVTEWNVSFRLADLNSHPSKGYRYVDAAGNIKKVKSPGWRLIVRSDSGNLTEIKISSGETNVDAATVQRALMVEVSSVGDFFNIPELRPKVQYRGVLKSGIDAEGGWNLFRVGYSSEEGLTFSAGNHGLNNTLKIEGCDLKIGNLEELVVEPMPGGRILMKYPAIGLPASPSSRKSTMEDGDIAERVRLSNDVAEGYWEILDYSVEEGKVRLGGDYRVAIVKNPDGRYDIIYLEGGHVNGEMWQKGMVKGTLSATGISGVYDVKWRDTMGRTLPWKMKAQIDGNVMTIFLPDSDSRFRLCRLKDKI